MEETIHFKLNGQPMSLSVDGERMLLWVLRSKLGLTGTKYGCGLGFCGACTVIANKEAIRACRFPVKDVKGKEIITIEGLAQNGDLHPLQKAFIKHDAFQCGFCTPGMILNAYSLLLKNPQLSRAGVPACGLPKSFRAWRGTCVVVERTPVLSKPSKPQRKK